MASPAAAAQWTGFFPADDISWKVDGGGGKDGGGAGKGEFRFQQNRPAGLLVTQPQLFTIPPGLSPATLLDSPSLFPGQGPFEMSHQQALAHVTAQAAQAHAFSSLLAVVPPTSLAQSSSFTFETSMQQNVLPSATNITKESTQLCGFDAT
ncbi:WRKY Transcription Factor [Dionaea muscipula]